MSLFNGHNKRDGKVSEAELHAVVLWITHPSYWLIQRSNIEA